MQPMGFSFDANAAEAAKKAGSSASIQESGAYVGMVTKAIYEFGQNGSQSQTLVLNIDSEGQKANYIRFNFVGKNGDQIFGYGLVMAAMWAAGVKDAQPAQRQGDDGKLEWYLPAMEGKYIGLVLHKVLTTKQSGADGYKLEPRHVFHPQTRLTYKEFSEKVTKPAEVDILSAALVAQGPKDDRTHNSSQQAGGWGAPNQPAGGGWGDQNAVPDSRLQQASRQHTQQTQSQQFDDDIPFAPIGLPFPRHALYAL